MIRQLPFWARGALVGLLLLGGGAAGAQQADTVDEEKMDGKNEDVEDAALQVYDSVEVRGRGDDLVGIAISAAEGTTGRVDLQQRAILRPGELVETTPGVIATQHSGGGKANQYFLRGFNLDHGTDFRVTVAGVPVNMPSHGHGQGYSDLNFLIPEMVDRVRYRKGPYYADQGDFSAAGGVDMELTRALPEAVVSATGGSYDYGRLLLADTFATRGGDLTAAVDLFHHDGPWTRGDDYDGFRGMVRYSRGDALRGFSLTALGYDADWLSTDQIPRRAVESGLVDRFDLLDPGPRGDTARYQLSAQLHRGTSDALTRFGAYLVSYDFRLISNFTYFLEDAEEGDQFEQVDDRVVAGLTASRHWMGSWGGRRVEHAAGFDLRADSIDNGLFRTRDLARRGSVRRDEVRQLTGGPWAETLIHWSDKVRARFGLRAELYLADVTSDLEANSGSADDVLLSPKASLILGPWRETEVYVNLGRGFHSNDARGATLRVDPTSGEAAAPADPLVRALGAEVGLRTAALGDLRATVSVFFLELDSELLFVGDGGATEASRPSRRVGVEWSNHYQMRPWLALELDATHTDARFRDRDPAGRRIPGAIEDTVAAALVADRGHYSASLRWRYFGGAPLIEDGSVRSGSTSLVNGRFAYRFANGLEVALEVFNLLDTEASDIEYFYASRLPGEPPGGIEDVHFHPLEGRSARLVTTWRP